MSAMREILQDLVTRAGGRKVVAQALGIKPGTLGHWITGERRPDFEQWAAFLLVCRATELEQVAAVRVAFEAWRQRRGDDEEEPTLDLPASPPSPSHSSVGLGAP